MFYVALETNSKELKFDFPHTPGEVLVDEIFAHLKVQDLKIAKWMLQDVQIRYLDLGIFIEPPLVKLNTNLNLSIVT
jgi:hypothetical protein